MVKTNERRKEYERIRQLELRTNRSFAVVEMKKKEIEQRAGSDGSDNNVMYESRLKIITLSFIIMFF